jgi:hypothetical protein
MNKSPPRTARPRQPPGFPRWHAGQITIGEIPPTRCAALAAETKKARVALVCRDDETISELLQRLDASLGQGDVGEQRRR